MIKIFIQILDTKYLNIICIFKLIINFFYNKKLNKMYFIIEIKY